MTRQPAGCSSPAPCGRGPDDPDVRTAREQVLADPATADLIARLPDWEGGAGFSGHNSPAFAPNLLNLLADMGSRRPVTTRGSRGCSTGCSTTRTPTGGSNRSRRCAARSSPSGAPCCATHTRSPRCSSGTGAVTTHASGWRWTGWPPTSPRPRRVPPGRADRTRPPASMARADGATCAHRCRSRGCEPSPCFRNPCAPRTCPRWPARCCRPGVIGPQARPTCSATGAASRPGSGRPPGTAR